MRTFSCALTCLALIAGLVSGDEEGSCSACPVTATHRLYGTKTKYSDAQRHIVSSVNASIPPTCEPIMLYLFKRHAIRYPDGEDIPEMNQTLEDIKRKALAAHAAGKSSLCPSAIEQLRNWRIGMRPEDDNLITTSGVKETQEIGTRTSHQLLPDLSSSLTQCTLLSSPFQLIVPSSGSLISWIRGESSTSQSPIEFARTRRPLPSCRRFTPRDQVCLVCLQVPAS